jgi:DNA-binding NarL/FixJ family response regulator
LHDPQTPVPVFTMHGDPVIVSRALEVGATGYVLNDTSSDQVLKAFQKVCDGRPYLGRDLASEVAFMEARGTTNPPKRMTVRARGQALWCDRRTFACELRDRCQHLHPAEGETRCADVA